MPNIEFDDSQEVDCPNCEAVVEFRRLSLCRACSRYSLCPECHECMHCDAEQPAVEAVPVEEPEPEPAPQPDDDPEDEPEQSEPEPEPDEGDEG